MGANSIILQAINDPRRIAVTKINANVLATGINFSSVVSPNVNVKPTILFYNRMFRFPLEIGYQEEDTYYRARST